MLYCPYLIKEILLNYMTAINHINLFCCIFLNSYNKIDYLNNIEKQVDYRYDNIMIDKNEREWKKGSCRWEQDLPCRYTFISTVHFFKFNKK